MYKPYHHPFFPADPEDVIERRRNRYCPPRCFHHFVNCPCAAGFALLNLPKGKSLGRSKPATSSYAQALQHTVWDSYHIQVLLNCLMRNKISTTNVSELGYLFHEKSSLHIIA